MARPLRVLLVEDNPRDAELLVRALRRAGFEPDWQRVVTEEDYLQRLDGGFDLILSDYELPRLNGLAALQLLKARGLDVPFIIVSGAIGEDTAVTAIKEGAADYLLKDRLGRLGPAILQALEQSRLRRERRQAEAALAERQEIFRAIVDQAADAIVLVDGDTLRFVEFNDAACAGLGYSREEFAGLSFAELHVDGGAGGATDSFHLRAGEQIETKQRRKNGTWRDAQISSQRIQIRGRDYFAAIWRDITGRKEAQEKLRVASEQLRALAARIERVREQERTTIAREIHDVLAQELTRLKIDLVWLGRRLARPVDEKIRPALAARATDAIAQTDIAISTVQRIATELRPAVLDSLGLAAAVEWQAGDFARRTGLAYHATPAPDAITLDRDRATALFRILQESLTNIARHARASAFDVRLTAEPRVVTLIVSDNGRGITDEECRDPRSIGLIGMRERAQAFGGTIQFTGTPGAGTTITVSLPAVAAVELSSP
jgi:two-component system sensor histidine kinase UhpB